MRKLHVGLLWVVAAASAIGVSAAEEVTDAQGRRHIPTITEKVRQSMAHALFVAEGQFSGLECEVQSSPASEPTARCEVKFQILRRLDRRKPTDSSIRFHLSAYPPRIASGRQTHKPDPDSIRKIELENSGKWVFNNQYLQKLAAARAPLLSANNYMTDFLVVPLALGGLDVPYRQTDVIVWFGKTYTIFVMKDIKPGEETTLFRNSIDIYDTTDPDVISVLNER
jgi:hypothetical protein